MEAAPQVTANFDWWTALGRGHWGCLTSWLPVAPFVLLGLTLALIVKLLYANAFGLRLLRFRRVHWPHLVLYSFNLMYYTTELHKLIKLVPRNSVL